MIKNSILFLLTISFFIGCANKNPTPQSQLDKELFNKIEQLVNAKDNKITSSKIKETIKKRKVLKKVVKNNEEFVEQHTKEALIINKKSDELVNKPLVVEPIFARIVIMPYTTKNGIYHEENSVWVKVKKAQIVMKANRFGATTSDSYKTILNN